MLPEILNVAWIFLCIISAGLIFSWGKNNHENGRLSNLDGLRYVLASFVAFHHNTYFYNLANYGKWEIKPEYKFEMFIGQFSVSLFFIISGYLFGDLKPETDWIKFYTKRFLRIVPTYYISVLICFFVAIAVSIKQKTFLKNFNFIYWLDGGVINYHPSIFGYNDSVILNAGVTWTLTWEWGFYFLVPMYFILIKKENRLPFCVAAISLLSYSIEFFNIEGSIFILLFFVGILSREIFGVSTVRPVKNINIDFISMFMFLTIVLGMNQQNPRSLLITLACGLFFATIINSSSWFGILSCRGFTILGDSSYCIYLFHGTFWYLTQYICHKKSISSNVYLFYFIQTLVWYSICGFSVFIHKKIEIPFILFGKNLKNLKKSFV